MSSTIFNGFVVALPPRLDPERTFRALLPGRIEPHAESVTGLLELEGHALGVILPDGSGHTYGTHQALDALREVAYANAAAAGHLAMLGSLGFSGPACVLATTEPATATSVDDWHPSDPFAPAATSGPTILDPVAGEFLVLFAVGHDRGFTAQIDALAGIPGVATFGPGCGVNGIDCWALAAYAGANGADALRAQAAAWRRDDGWTEAALFGIGSGTTRLLDATRLPGPEEAITPPPQSTR